MLQRYFSSSSYYFFFQRTLIMYLTMWKSVTEINIIIVVMVYMIIQDGRVVASTSFDFSVHSKSISRKSF